MGIVLGIKNHKGTVSVENFKNRIRLRWRYHRKRYSLSFGSYDKVNMKVTTYQKPILSTLDTSIERRIKVLLRPDYAKNHIKG